MKKYLYLILCSVLLASCKNGSQFLQNVSGKAGEVIVVTDQKIWDKTLNDTVHKILGFDYPALPQREPVFDIIHVQETSFSNIFKLHRNIVLLKITPDSIPENISIIHDRWAKPQTLVVVNAKNGDDIIALLSRNQERMIHILEQAERDRVISASKKYEERQLRDTVNAIFGGSPYFPAGYVLRKKTQDFVWIGYETQKTILGIFLYKYPYKDSTDFQLPNLIAERNSILKKEVPGQFENTYMTTVLLFPPQTRSIRYKNFHFVETRGLWEIENDFMGGPFISHSFIDSSGENIITLEAFVYNPKNEKRNHLRQLESMLYSFEWKQNQNN
jgi:hypothetical protein